MADLILVTVADGPADASAPLLFADDLAAVRGDGIFETLLVREGRPCGVRRHLDRLARSAAIVDLPAPDREAFAAAVDAAARLWTEQHADAEGLLRIVYSRGREADPASAQEPDKATAYVTVGPVAPRAIEARESGVSVVTLDRGYSVDLAPSAPWALLGAKTLSYATNMAALRHAARLGYDDVIYLSSEGVVLEGPRSTVVAVTGKTLVTPPTEAGILPGTTQEALFELAEAQGWQTKSETLLTEDLIAADSVWMVSSVTLAARVRRLNSYEFGDDHLGDREQVDLAALVNRAIADD
ncbi:putative aminotransferase [Gordonia effusa NBRC 100432]|uniref:Putative aminotransferase n=1 Tax=Gordonia effusa NBRC 100432 TaxID=1077974 RepID=H0R4E6_9ACTN|nr:aminodeoxychorismate lyase [Gordonia effusa]GAB19947.1 putative aminotransferase [Gordonia effusa NBRC 100432]